MWHLTDNREAYLQRAKQYRAKRTPPPARVGKGILLDSGRKKNIVERMWRKLNGF